LKNLRFIRLPLDSASSEEEIASLKPNIVPFRNVGGLRGAYVTGSRPIWLMNFRERLQVHPQVMNVRNHSLCTELYLQVLLYIYPMSAPEAHFPCS
jgi:hypothetical protein